MDVARALYLDLTGQPVSQAPFQEGRKWIVEDLDLLASLRYVRDGKMTFKHCLGSFRGVRETAYFAVDDPRPFFAMCMSRGKELGRRMFRNMRRGAARHFKPAYSANRWA